MQDYVLHSTSPAADWRNSYPLGNGRMGVSLIGGVPCEKLYLNEETVWGSKTGAAPNPAMPEKLAKIRELFLDGFPVEANRLAEESLGDCFSRISSYESAGILNIRLHNDDYCTNYRRDLDITHGVSYTEYDRCSSHYSRQCFVSYPDDVVVYHVSSSNTELDAYVSFDRECTLSTSTTSSILTAIAETAQGRNKFCVKVKVITDGTVTASGNELHITSTKSFTVLLTISTEFRHGDSFESMAKFPSDVDFSTLKSRHAEDVFSLMSRADISLPTNAEMDRLSLSERRGVTSFNRVEDNGFLLLQWQYGRYLTVASSRPGTLPSNLQGLWTDALYAPWSSDYHTNINLQMNYWPAEVANLSECHLPLFAYMNDYLLESGKKTAEIAYNARGCVVHHLSDIYNFTCPADGLWGIWPHGANWLVYHMWEHYLFTNDIDFLRDTAYEFIKQASLFFLDTMVEDKKGQLVYAPSTSPENRYYAHSKDGTKSPCFLSMSSTMDTAIIGGLFRIFIDASNLLGISDEDVKSVSKAKEKLPPFRIGKFGQIMEWIEDYDEVDIGHRHLSPAFGLYPDCAINHNTPELMQAVDTMLTRRKEGRNNSYSNYGSSMGWSIAWQLALYSRLRNGGACLDLINTFLGSYSSIMSLDLKDIKDLTNVYYFQIDGIIGFTAGICEMLIQSHEGYISLLPALPKTWNVGEYNGLCARGNFGISLKWEDRSIYEIKINGNGKCRIELPESQKDLTFIDEAGKVYTAENNIFEIDVCESSSLSVHSK